MADERLTISELEVHFGDNVALAGVDLRIGPATTVAVIGPNGSGKSTLLHAIAGLVKPVRGSIDTHRSRISLVLQSTDVDTGVPITVRETVAMARYATRGLLGRFRSDDHDAVDRAIERLDIGPLAERQLHDLSGGQRQRVLVAQGVAQDADILLLDEPVTGLDLTSRDLILDVIREERAAGRTVITTTHSLDDARRCDLVLLLATRPIAVGPPAEVIQEDNLRSAFRSRAVRVGDDYLMDDPHHVH